MESVPNSRASRRPRWRKIRISLRGLIVLVLLVGGVVGWVAHTPRIRREATAAVLASRGNVGFGDGTSRTGARPIPGTIPSQPPSVLETWLARHLGPEYFTEVISVSTGGPKADDALMAPVGRLTGLESLILREPTVTDAGLSHLKGLKSLKTLEISARPGWCWGTDWGNQGRMTHRGLANLKDLPGLRSLDLTGAPMEDADIAHLSGMVHLETLALPAERITDAGMAHLATLVNLRSLTIGGLDSQITSAGLVHLRGMTRLVQLDLGGAHVTDLSPLSGLRNLSDLELNSTWVDDAGLAGVSDLMSLQQLFLERTRVTDAGLRHVSRLSNLGHLKLIQTNVGDPGLSRLAGLSKLWYADLQLTRVTPSGVAALQAARPKLIISAGPFEETARR